MASQQTEIVNGVNVNGLFTTIETVKASPGIAKLRFRLQNKWLDGGLNRSTINKYYGAGEEHERGKDFVLEADEPPMLLGQDRAPNPVEYLLQALAACVTTSMVYQAAARGIKIDEIECTLEGDIDLRGFLGLDKNVRNGYQGIRMNYRIAADVPDQQLQDLCQLGPQFSPVFDSVTKGVPVSVKAERLSRAEPLPEAA